MGDEGGFRLGSGQQGIRQLQVMEEAAVGRAEQGSR